MHHSGSKNFCAAALVAFSAAAAMVSSPASADDMTPVCDKVLPVQFCDVSQIVPPTNAVEMIYAPTYNVLVLKNAGSAIASIDLLTTGSSFHFSNTNFTDMAISPSGRFVFAADYGGENIGYGTPSGASYVHRLDLSTGLWDTKTAYIAGQIQVVSDDTFVLKSIDQWITFTYNAWGTNPAVTILNASGSAYYASVYEGNFRFEPTTGRLLHGNSGESSQEIRAFKISNNNFVVQEGSGIYGSAQGYGPNVTLATDGSAFYYGQLQVDALDTTHNLRVFSEPIYAATGNLAFGNAGYYDAKTGALAGALSFQGTVYALNPNGADFWVFDPTNNLLHHMVPDDRLFSDGFGG